MGMLIVVQGFETSRFIGSEHSADERIRSMRFAQWISTGVYLVFLSLVAVMFAGPSAPAGTDVTAIILVAGAITPLLAAAVAITAIGSQFTASTADFAGCAGLMESAVARIVPARFVYVLIAAVSILITWATDVFEIISLASRAFALFYALQCFVALLTSVRTFSTEHNKSKAIARASLFALLGIVCLAVAALGIPAG